MSDQVLFLIEPSCPLCSHTGTFFCEMTTAQSFPLTPIEVMLAAVMALKAYSERQ
jgi:hypothetical protein